MPESEMAADAKVAAQIKPVAVGATPPPAQRTPRWIVALIIPVVAIVLLYLSRQILGPFVIAGVIAYIFTGVIDSLQERLHWPRALVVSLVYLLVLGILGLGLYFGAEALYRETRALLNSGPGILETALQQALGRGSYSFGGQTVDAHSLAQRINDGLATYFGTGGGGSTTLRIAGEVVGRLLDTLLVLVVSFYLLVGGKAASAYFLKFVPFGARARTGYVAGRINTVLSAYLRGQLLLILIMSAAAFILLKFIFNVPNALPLAILTGFFEILPLLGPAIAALLAAGVALVAHGPTTAIAVIVAYTILREVEDQVVMPFVVGRAVELHPVVTIFAVLAGGAIAGPLGMLLAVPAAAASKVILDFVYPTDPDEALQQARPGMRLAEQEGAARGEAPAAPAAPADVQP